MLSIAQELKKMRQGISVREKEVTATRFNHLAKLAWLNG